MQEKFLNIGMYLKKSNEIVGMHKMSYLPRFIRFIDLKTTAPPPRSNENSTNRSTIEIVEMETLKNWLHGWVLIDLFYYVLSEIMKITMRIRNIETAISFIRLHKESQSRKTSNINPFKTWSQYFEVPYASGLCR